MLGLRCCSLAFCSCGEWGLLSSCGAWAPHYGVFSHHRARALGFRDFSSFRSWPLGCVSVVEHRLSCLVASSQTRDRIPCPLHWQVDSWQLDHQRISSISFKGRYRRTFWDQFKNSPVRVRRVSGSTSEAKLALDWLLLYIIEIYYHKTFLKDEVV